MRWFRRRRKRPSVVQTWVSEAQHAAFEQEQAILWGEPPPPVPDPVRVYDERNTTVPTKGRFRKCGKCGFVAVILADQPYQMLDWIIDDHYYRYHARPSAAERAR